MEKIHIYTLEGKKGRDKEDKIEKKKYVCVKRREHEKDSKGGNGQETEGHKELRIHLVLSGERSDEEKPG